MNQYEKLVNDRIKYWANCPLLEITDIKQQSASQCCTAYINGVKVFISYYTVVAFEHPESGWMRTDRRYSVTTSKQMTKFLRYRGVIELEHGQYRQELTDKLGLTDRQVENIT